MPATQAARKAQASVRRAPVPVKLAGISDEAVEHATGRNWAQWLKVLDKDGAAALSHRDIAKHVRSAHGVGDWWSQMVTVGYEQGRGLRQKHQMADGFRISGSKTVGVPVKALYRAWADESTRERWLPRADLTVRTKIPGKSMRITWDAGKRAPTSLLVAFYAKGPSRSQVTIEHSKLASPSAGDRAKKFWKQRLGALAKQLGSAESD